MTYSSNTSRPLRAFHHRIVFLVTSESQQVSRFRWLEM